MHELTLACDILELVENAARRDNFHRVACLHLEAGALAGVEVSALRFALESLAAGTCLEGAQVRIDEPPGVAWCERCQNHVSILSRTEPCPLCDGYPLRPTGGDSLRVLDLLVQNT
ncbi:MAG: hydrogenase nickel incorporation protein HypA/HybF [Gammaproteobacteria bacterium]|jgi:hydrogenase nickel incorporation protein HypA/HybF